MACKGVAGFGLRPSGIRTSPVQSMKKIGKFRVETASGLTVILSYAELVFAQVAVGPGVLGQPGVVAVGVRFSGGGRRGLRGICRRRL